MSEEIFERAKEAIIKGDADTSAELARQGLDKGIAGIDLINKGFIPGINDVGDKFGEGQLFLPELILSANAMQGVIDIVNASMEIGEKTEPGQGNTGNGRRRPPRHWKNHCGLPFKSQWIRGKRPGSGCVGGPIY